jgi:hypothetical protein
MRSYEQMLGANAGWFVTGMTDKQPGRDGTTVHLPREPMRPLSVTVDIKHSITKFLRGTSPQPTGFGFLDMLPEPLFWRDARVNTSHELLYNVKASGGQS